MKTLFLSIAFLLVSCNLFAQSFEDYKRQASKWFDKKKHNAETEFNTYRDSINREFANYMRQVWPEYEAKPANPVPERPEPPVPMIKKPDEKSSNTPISFDLIKRPPTSIPVAPPKPVVPNNQPSKTTQPQFKFPFYGTLCSVSLSTSHQFKLSGVDENSVADAWLQLTNDKYNIVVADCLAWKEKLRLPDWGYLRFVEKMTTAFFPAHSQNEAKLLQMYILTQSGYKVRIARSGKSLVLLLPSNENIYQYPYLAINNSKYYIIDKDTNSQTYHLFDREFPKEQYFSLNMANSPLLSIEKTDSRTLTSKHFPSASVTITTNRNLIEFYNDYPLTDLWSVYVKSSMIEKTKEQLYPALRQAIAGKDQHQAANILLNFVQTAFAYKTDGSQFGYERPLFADETLYYPYCDCEDRSILFAILARELLELDVVLLYYPNHVATAVCFNQNILGDYLQIGNKRYVVCDPTYINADVGNTMPQFKNVVAKITPID